uniref:Uncharacterized protein MANES_03G094900 n=1 Tax=Rhizophora mucronata TaxID=61149 RepID=A0A2P2JF37_RHIMU
MQIVLANIIFRKYHTLLLKFQSKEGSEEVIAAITFQLVPSDTQCAEVPLAAVSSSYQNKGYGHFLYLELRKRLQSVGVCTVYCWGDKESEGFWLKQGFKSIGEVDGKGKAHRLPIKADIRRALCFPGGSMLMVSQLNENSSAKPADSLKKSEEVFGENTNLVGFSQHQDCADLTPYVGGELSKMATGTALLKIVSSANVKWCSHKRLGAKRSWEASLSSLKSKKVKGRLQIACASDSNCDSDSESDRIDPCNNSCSLNISQTSSRVEVDGADPLKISAEVEKSVNVPSEAPASKKFKSTGECFRIMLMNIADDTKKRNLVKVIENLGGYIVLDGHKSTHVVTGKVRRTLNFCTALCSGAWIVSSSWLKESFQRGRFVEEAPHVLHDEDYALQYRDELRNAVLRAKVRPGALLKGYDICIAFHVQPPVETLATIVRSAGGNVISSLDKVSDASKAIFVACEEDMEEALLASMKGIWTFCSEWLMNCIMRQELDFGALKFAESL